MKGRQRQTFMRAIPSSNLLPIRLRFLSHDDRVELAIIGARCSITHLLVIPHHTSICAAELLGFRIVQSFTVGGAAGCSGTAEERMQEFSATVLCP